MILVYNFMMIVAIGLFWPVWIPLVWTRKKYRRTFFNRLFMEALPGSDPESADNRKRIWIHALSVGEVLSAEPFIKVMAQKHGARALIFTASTQTGFEMARRVIAPHVRAVRYFPYDTPISVDRALRVIKPRQVVVVETDIWPNFLYRLNTGKIPVNLINARLSDRSFRGYQRIGILMAPLLSLFARICVQTDADRMRFRKLGVPGDRVVTVGNIKFDQALVNVCDDDLIRLVEKLKLTAGAPIWVAGSTHEGEETLLSATCRTILAGGIDAVLIVAPRDPGRAEKVCRIFQRSGVDGLTVKQIERQPRSSRVVVVDRIGMLRQLYALADVAFVGGSLVKAGGHNPLEPASVKKPILFGPHTEDFRWICQALENAGGAFRVDDAEQLAERIGQLILDKEKRRDVGRCAYKVFANNRGAVERTLAAIENN